MDELVPLSETITILLRLDESIKELNNQQKELKKKRDIIEDKVLEILNKNKLTEKKFLLNNNSIFCIKSNTLPPINTLLLETILSKYISKNEVDFILKQIDDYRQNNRKETILLKRKAIKNKSLKRIK
jgi:hypothetical protein